MKPSDLKDLYSSVQPSQKLDDEVLTHIGKLRAAGSQPRTSRHALAPVLACAAALALIALCIGLVTGKPQPSVSNAFSLEVAQADDATGQAQLEASTSGLMPIREGIGPNLNLRLNLDVRGANVSSVTYRMADSPTRTIRVSGQRRGDEEPIQTHDTVGLSETSETDDLGLLDRWGETVTIGYQQGSGVGAYQTASGLYPTLFADGGGAEYWSSDHALALLHKWTSEGAGFDEDDLDPAHTRDDEEEFPYSLEDIDAAEDEYHAAFDSHTTSQQDFLDWMRSLYVTGYEFAGAELADARLEATVTFADGSTQTHLYRIYLVNDYEQTLSDRFDALCDLDGDFSQQLSSKLPWKRWATPTTEQIAADPRLSVPIFAIEEIDE